LRAPYHLSTIMLRGSVLFSCCPLSYARADKVSGND